jgi:hypothetical protein
MLLGLIKAAVPLRSGTGDEDPYFPIQVLLSALTSLLRIGRHGGPMFERDFQAKRQWEFAIAPRPTDSRAAVAPQS